jgi:Rrf2 family nitric oxide-sensitive transcriptional repressor
LQGNKGYCRIEDCCVLRRALRDATNAFLATLDGYTLADLVKPRQSLGRLLALDGAIHASRPQRRTGSRAALS